METQESPVIQGLEWFNDKLHSILDNLGWWHRFIPVYDASEQCLIIVVMPTGKERHNGSAYQIHIRAEPPPMIGWRVVTVQRGRSASTGILVDRAIVCEKVVEIVTYGEIHAVLDQEESHG